MPVLFASNQSHLLFGKVLREASPADLALLTANPPYVLKLSHHGFPADLCAPRFAAWQALRRARGHAELRRTAGFVAVGLAFRQHDNASHAMHYFAPPPPPGAPGRRDARG